MKDEPVGSPDRGAPAARILIVDDDLRQVNALCNVLRHHGYSTVGCASGKDALAELQAERHDVLMTDLLMPGLDGMALLHEAQRIDPDLMGVIMTGQGSVETAVEAMKSGAQDYVLKPLQLEAVRAVLERVMSMRRLRMDNRSLLQHLSSRTRELEAANAELEAFTDSVTHDLRAPLQAIHGFYELLEADFSHSLTADAREHLRRIGQGAVRMNGVINDLLRLSHVGRSPLERRDVDMRALALKALAQLSPGIRDPRARVRVGELPPARADARLVEHVFTNLLSNAFKFTRGRSDAAVRIDFELGHEGKAYLVEDNGAGFDMSEAHKLFGPFQRLHRPDQFEGTGVGLSIVKRIIERHGGRVWAEAQVGRGARFFFTLC